MHRVLIADANPERACHLEADLLDLGVKAISVVSGEMAVAFCREYELDLILLDLGMSDARNSVRLLRECESTMKIPIMGFSGGDDETGWEELYGVLDGNLERLELAQELLKCLPGWVAPISNGGESGESMEPLYENPLVELLRLSERIQELARELKSSAGEFGPDGPEMFKFVEKSSHQMHQHLIELESSEPELQKNRLRDREVRHEFRNILASVRGFTDLILMEEGIPENLVTGLKEICDCSNQFVEWLDAEKLAALNN